MAIGIPIIDSILGVVDTALDKIFPDKTEAEKAKAAIKTAILDMDKATLVESAKIVLGEIQGESWLQRNWRPILMLSIVTIVVNNYIAYPYLAMFGVKATLIELPEHLWILMKIGVGGYVVGRSTEKIAESLSGASIFDIFKKKNGK